MFLSQPFPIHLDRPLELSPVMAPFVCITCGRSLKNEAGLVQHCRDKQHVYRAPAPAPVTVVRPPVPTPVSVPAPAPAPAASAASFMAPNRSAVGSPFRVGTPGTSAGVGAQRYECRPCCVSFSAQAALDAHNALRHPVSSARPAAVPAPSAPRFPSPAPAPVPTTAAPVPAPAPAAPAAQVPKAYLVKCAPCGLDFASADALAAHFRSSSAHPKCALCAAAFVDRHQLELHAAAHPACKMCAVIVRDKAALEEVRGSLSALPPADDEYRCSRVHSTCSAHTHRRCAAHAASRMAPARATARRTCARRSRTRAAPSVEKASSARRGSTR